MPAENNLEKPKEGEPEGEKAPGEKKEKPKYKVICAWCGKDLGEKEGVSETSHGICPECRDKFMGDLGKEGGAEE